MKYYEAKFSNGETAYFACIASDHRPEPEEITLNFPNLVAAFVAPCVKIRQIGLHTANMMYDKIHTLRTEIGQAEAAHLYCHTGTPVYVTTRERTLWQLPPAGAYGSHAPAIELFYRSLPEYEGPIQFFK